MTRRPYLYVADLPCGHRAWHNHAAIAALCLRCERRFAWPRWVKYRADVEAMRVKENWECALHIRMRAIAQLKEDDYVDATAFQLLRSTDEMLVKLEWQLDELLNNLEEV